MAYLVNSEQRERDNIVDKAIRFGSKIWNGEKLESVLSRCLESQPTKSSTAALSKLQHSQQRQLSRLLHTEKIHGTTERDPTQKRHDYHYFSRGSCFVLLEDIRQELATIAAHEYPVFKERDKLAKKPWPVLHCHPRARNPFLPYDDREKKRWERLQQAEKEQEEERMATKRELQALKARKVVKATNDLRKSVSVSNLHRRHSVPTRRTHDEPFVDLDNEDGEPANASGYIAASGNSVGITSTTGTTSTAGRPGRANSLTPAIAGRLKNHVVTSLKFPAKDKPGEKVGATGTMGPPSQLPNKENVLKRSKSTNTLRLPKRQEGVKPGYCESCRIKFSDFNDVSHFSIPSMNHLIKTILSTRCPIGIGSSLPTMPISRRSMLSFSEFAERLLKKSKGKNTSRYACCSAKSAFDLSQVIPVFRKH